MRYSNVITYLPLNYGTSVVSEYFLSIPLPVVSRFIQEAQLINAEGPRAHCQLKSRKMLHKCRCCHL